MQQVEVQLTDEQGHFVRTDDHEVMVEISGPGELAGIESSDIASHENYQSNKRKTYNGKLLIYIKSKGQHGQITHITLTSPGLQTKTISFKID